jgi:alkylation response protein AidB-like acyl-CoA dehydrogenase
MDTLEAARAFAREVIEPHAARWEEERRYPREAFAEAGARGLCGLVVPVEKGGAGLGAAATIRVIEVLAGADMAFSFGLIVHNNLAGAIARHGAPRHIGSYLGDLIAGRRIGAFLLTEPQGGSDAAAILTRARRRDGGRVIDGEKAWVSNGAGADLLSVYAQTDPDLGWRGIACFLVEAGWPGVVREPAYRLMGGHALGAGAFRFEDCRVGGEALLLGPGDGFKAAMAGIDLARVNVAAMCRGMMRVGLELALTATAERRAFGRAIADFQGIQWMLADAATDLEASRLLADEAARRLDAGEDATLAAAHAKKFATRAALVRLADCMQVMGAPGYCADCPLSRHLACAKMAQYLDGTTEIQNLVISRALRRGPPAG